MELQGKWEKESPNSDGHKAVIFFSPEKVWKGITRNIFEQICTKHQNILLWLQQILHFLFLYFKNTWASDCLVGVKISKLHSIAFNSLFNTLHTCC